MIGVKFFWIIADAIRDAIDQMTQWIIHAFQTLFFYIVRLLFSVLDVFMDIIFKLAGFSNLDSGGNILSMFFSNSNDGSSHQIATLYMYLCLVCAGLMLFFAVIQIIRQDFFSEAGPQSHAPIFKKMFIGLLWFIAIPPVFIFAVDLISGLIAALMRIDTFSQLDSMSQAIFEMCLETPEWVRNANAAGEKIRLDPIPHWNAMNARDFISLCNMYNFNFLVFVAVLIMSFYSLFMLAFGLVKRIISLVFLYVMGPIAISQSVLDNGAKMKKWQSSVVSKFTSVFGTIISLVLLFVFITEIVENLNFFPVAAMPAGLARTGAVLANTVIKALFIFVAFDMIKKGEIISDFISNLTVADSASVAKTAASYGKIATNVAKMPIAAAQNVVKGAQTAKGLASGFFGKNGILNGGSGNEYTDNFRLPGILNKDNWRDDVHKQRHDEYLQAKSEMRKDAFKLGLGPGEHLAFNTAADAGSDQRDADVNKFIDRSAMTKAIDISSKDNMQYKYNKFLDESNAKMGAAKDATNGTYALGAGGTVNVDISNKDTTKASNEALDKAEDKLTNRLSTANSDAADAQRNYDEKQAKYSQLSSSLATLSPGSAKYNRVAAAASTAKAEADAAYADLGKAQAEVQTISHDIEIVRNLRVKVQNNAQVVETCNEAAKVITAELNKVDAQAKDAYSKKNYKETTSSNAAGLDKTYSAMKDVTSKKIDKKEIK